MSLIKKIQDLFTEASHNDIKMDCGRVLRFSNESVSEITEDGLNELKSGFFTSEGKGYFIGETVLSSFDFIDVLLKDGPFAHVISVKSGEISEGDKLIINGFEASPGEYPISDGKILFVDEQGIITQIKTKKEIMANKKRFSALKKFEEAEAVEAVEITIVAEELVEGAEVVVIDENLTVEESYTGTLEVDGVDMVIAEGVLTEIVEPAAEEVVEEVVEAEPTEEFKAVLEKVEALFSKIEALESDNKNLKAEVMKFSSEPSAEPTKTKVDFKKADKTSKLEFFSKK
jgi:hypothetical protein